MIPSEKSKAILENEAKETLAKLRAGANQPTSDELMEEIERRWKEWISKDQDHVEGILAKSEFAYFALHFARWQREQMLKKAVGEGWIARNSKKENGRLIFVPGEEPPTRMKGYWFAGFSWGYTEIPDDAYPELKWEDEPKEVKLIIL